MTTATAETTGLIKFKTPLSELANIESIASECQLVMSGAHGNFQRALTMAKGIAMLRQALTPEIMAGIMALQGSKLGFKTDKDKDGGYPVDVVKDCAIEHVLRGGMLVGNEMNIIAANAYQTKEFFTRMLTELPGFTDLKLFPGVPVAGGDRRALVAYSATWKYLGQPGRIDRVQTKLEDGTLLDERLSIVSNSGMGPDAILGKAERKIRAAIYSRLTGTIITDADIDDAGPARRQVANLEDLTQRLEDKTDANGLKPGETMTAGGEIKPDETSQLDILDGIEAQFAAFDLKGPATILYDSLCSPDATKDLSDAQRTLVTAWYEAATLRVERSRGAKSNQKSLAGAT